MSRRNGGRTVLCAQGGQQHTVVAFAPGAPSHNHRRHIYAGVQRSREGQGRREGGGMSGQKNIGTQGGTGGKKESGAGRPYAASR